MTPQYTLTHIHKHTQSVHTLPVSLTFQLLVSSVPAQPGGGFAASTGAGQGDFAPLRHCILKAGDLRFTGHTYRERERERKTERERERDRKSYGVSKRVRERENFYAAGLTL